MKNKIKLVHKQMASFNSDWLRGLVEQYFELESWDPTKTYPKNSLFYLNCMDFPHANNQLPAAPEELANRGFRVIVDNLWEVDTGGHEYAYTVSNPAWFWYNESLWYRHLGYDQYQPQRTGQYLALMPMRLHKKHRTRFLKAVHPLLDQMIWSYVAWDRQLPNDRDINDWNTQRYFNPEWYDQTYTSAVVETYDDQESQYTPVFITEKTMKPLAFQHPLLVYGNPNTLYTLREWGFETFDNLWDESYDTIADSGSRCNAIADILKELTVGDYDAETVRRIKHNRDHFFDRELVIDKIKKEIINPIIEYAET